MASPKAPAWLRLSFRDGVDERFEAAHPMALPAPAYPGAHPACWLAQFDPKQRPCDGQRTWDPLERFHFLRRQDVEAAMWQQLLEATVAETCPYCVEGFIADVEPECCGNTTSSGECRGDCAVPRQIEKPCPSCDGGFIPAPLLKVDADDLVLLAAWDPRNGGLGCERHHRRYDGHAVSPREPKIIVPYSALPDHVPEFAFNYGVDRLLDRFPSSI